MRAWAIQDKFGIEALTLTERPEPQPGPRQVLIKLRAAALNYRDPLRMQGFYDPHQHFDTPQRLALPLIPISDSVGEVVRVGEGVTTAKVGDRVAGSFAQKWIAGKHMKP